MDNNNYFIIGGTLGSGKTTLINALRQKGLLCVDESARAVIAEQKAIDGEGLYYKDQNLFVNLMLSRCMCRYQQYQEYDQPIIFDRAIPDAIAYADVMGLDKGPAQRAAQLYRYNLTVLWLPSWPEIYVNDEDRTLSFERALSFGQQLKDAYISAGYELTEVPKLPPDERANFVIEFIG